MVGLHADVLAPHDSLCSLQVQRGGHGDEKHSQPKPEASAGCQRSAGLDYASSFRHTRGC